MIKLNNDNDMNKWLMWMLLGISALILNWTIIGCGCIIYGVYLSDDVDRDGNSLGNRLE